MLRFTFIYFRCFPFGPVSSSTFDSVACVCIVAVAAIGATVYLRWGGIFAVVYCVQHQALFHYFLYCCFFIYFSRETTTQVHVAHEILVRVRFSALSGFSLLALYGCVCVCQRWNEFYRSNAWKGKFVCTFISFVFYFFIVSFI